MEESLLNVLKILDDNNKRMKSSDIELQLLNKQPSHVTIYAINQALSNSELKVISIDESGFIGIEEDGIWLLNRK